MLDLIKLTRLSYGGEKGVATGEDDVPIAPVNILHACDITAALQWVL